MPWDELLSDFLRNQRESRRQSSNDRWTKLMQTLGLAKDVWTTVSGRKAEEEAATTLFGRQKELAEKQHGWNLEEYGKKYDYDRLLADVNWARQQAKDRGDEEAAKRLANFNDELERKRNNQTFVNSMIEIAARGEWDEKIQRIANAGQGTSTDIIKWYNLAREEATAKFYLQDPDTGGYTLKPGVTENQIREFFYKWADSADEADRPRLRAMFDAWIKDPYWEDQQNITINTASIQNDPESLANTIMNTAGIVGPAASIFAPQLVSAIGLALAAGPTFAIGAGIAYGLIRALEKLGIADVTPKLRDAANRIKAGLGDKLFPPDIGKTAKDTGERALSILEQSRIKKERPFERGPGY